MLSHEGRKMHFDSVAVGAGELDDVGYRQPAMLICQLQNGERQGRKRFHQDPLALHFFLKPAFLLLKGTKEKAEPWLPVRCA